MEEPIPETVTETETETDAETQTQTQSDLKASHKKRSVFNMHVRHVSLTQEK